MYHGGRARSVEGVVPVGSVVCLYLVGHELGDDEVDGGPVRLVGVDVDHGHRLVARDVDVRKVLRAQLAEHAVPGNLQDAVPPPALVEAPVHKLRDLVDVRPRHGAVVALDPDGDRPHVVVLGKLFRELFKGFALRALKGKVIIMRMNEN